MTCSLLATKNGMLYKTAPSELQLICLPEGAVISPCYTVSAYASQSVKATLTIPMLHETL